MNIYISKTPEYLGQAAGTAAAILIRKAIAEKGKAAIILATGTSQFETLNQLISEPRIDWQKVELFHLDEYIGLPISSKASFRKYLKERFIDLVPDLKSVNLINAEQNPKIECKRLNELISQKTIDVALVGIGENGHLAFNDPPADFDTHTPFIIVKLDEACRQQQFGEGWFKTLNDVPTEAISMSIQQILKSNKIICSVPDSRKAEAVENSLESPISNKFPASILQSHPECSIYLDVNSAELLSGESLNLASII
ncbi:MAG: glucosamine-6-phosphate deaminase [Arcticibacterium sp.]